MRQKAIWRKLLLGTLGIALAFEVLFALAAICVPAWTLGMFGMPATIETEFLAFAMGWTFVFIAMICSISLKQVAAGNKQGHLLVDALGYWWIIVGIAVFLKGGKADNLFLDSAKGALLVFFNAKARR